MVDTHMGTLLHPQFLPTYVKLATERRLPLLALRPDAEALRARGYGEGAAAFLARAMHDLLARVVPLFDHVVELPLDQPTERVARAKRVFDDLRPGFTLIIIHPSHDTPELRAIASSWPSRVADSEAFTSAELRDYVRNLGVHVIGYRALREPP